jgi:hypothetical protein
VCPLCSSPHVVSNYYCDAYVWLCGSFSPSLPLSLYVSCCGKFSHQCSFVVHLPRFLSFSRTLSNSVSLISLSLSLRISRSPAFSPFLSVCNDRRKQLRQHWAIAAVDFASTIVFGLETLDSFLEKVSFGGRVVVCMCMCDVLCVYVFNGYCCCTWLCSQTPYSLSLSLIS